jgi:hypothetical protein
MNLPIEILNYLEPCAVCGTIAWIRAVVGQTPKEQVFSLTCIECGYVAPPREDLETAGRIWNAVQGVREHHSQK